MARKRLSDNPIVVSSGAAAAPARRKSPTSKPSSYSPAPVEASHAPQIEPSVVPVEPVAEVLSASAPAKPSYQDVALLAYSYWQARGYQGGSPEEDWVRAEQELSAR